MRFQAWHAHALGRPGGLVEIDMKALLTGSESSWA
jgi:hypothetical protein